MVNNYTSNFCVRPKCSQPISHKKHKLILQCCLWHHGNPRDDIGTRASSFLVPTRAFVSSCLHLSVAVCLFAKIVVSAEDQASDQTHRILRCSQSCAGYFLRLMQYRRSSSIKSHTNTCVLLFRIYRTIRCPVRSIGLTEVGKNRRNRRWSIKIV